MSIMTINRDMYMDVCACIDMRRIRSYIFKQGQGKNTKD